MTTDATNLLAERDERIAGLEAVIDAAGEIGSQQDLGALLELIMARGKELLHCEACSLMLLDEATNELVFKVAQSQVGANLTDAFRLPLGQGVAGWVAANRKPYVANDAYASELFSTQADEATGFRTRAILCVPLFANGKLVGVAQVLNPIDGRDFDDGDVALFEDLAMISAVAIENTRLRCAHEELGRLEKEMQLAREIQDSFLPHAFPEVAGYSLRAGTQPATWVGGDLYDVQMLNSGMLALVVGDVSGKGASSSLHGARTLSETRLLLEFCQEPEAVMARLNNITYERSSRGMFVTLLLMLLKPESGELTVISAGHPAPLIYDFGADEFVAFRAPKAPPLGVVPDVGFRSVTLQLPQECLLTAFSDGIVEARDACGQAFDFDRLRESIRRAAQHKERAIERLRDDVVQFSGAAKQHDDATLLCLRRG